MSRTVFKFIVTCLGKSKTHLKQQQEASDLYCSLACLKTFPLGSHFCFNMEEQTLILWLHCCWPFKTLFYVTQAGFKVGKDTSN